MHKPSAAAAAAPAPAGPCAGWGYLDFFPAGTVNQPPAWSRKNQEEAGNTERTSLFPVALFGFPEPELHFMPAHPLLSAGGVAPGERAVRRVAHEPDRDQRRVGLAEGELDEALPQHILGEDVRLAHGAMICDSKGRAAAGRGLAEPWLAAGRPFP